MRQRRAAAMSSARAAREREQRRGKGSRESRERGERQRGLRAYPDTSGRLGGKQEVARAASAVATELLRGEGEVDDRVEEVGWADQLRWAARWARAPGKFVFYFILILFFV